MKKLIIKKVKPWSQDWLIAAGAYPGFCSMKWLEVFPLLLDGMLVHRRSHTWPCNYKLTSHSAYKLINPKSHSLLKLLFALTDWLLTSNMHWIYIPFQVGVAVASWLARSTPVRAVWVRALAGDIVLCSWARQFTLTVLLSTQVYKWVPANCWDNLTNCGEVTWDGLSPRPCPGEVCYRNRDKFRQLWAYLGSKASHFSELN